MEFNLPDWPVTLWHLSPHVNKRLIAKQGLLPAKSRGARRRVWLCETSHIWHIYNHLTEMYTKEVYDLWLVNGCFCQAVARRREGIWTTAAVVPHQGLTLVAQFVSPPDREPMMFLQT